MTKQLYFLFIIARKHLLDKDKTHLHTHKQKRSQHFCWNVEVHTPNSSLKMLIFKNIFFWLVFHCSLGNEVFYGSYFSLWFITLKHRSCLDFWKGWCLKRKSFDWKFQTGCSLPTYSWILFSIHSAKKIFNQPIHSNKLVSFNGKEATYSWPSFCSLQRYNISAESRLKHQLEKDMTLSKLVRSRKQIWLLFDT